MIALFVQWIWMMNCNDMPCSDIPSIGYVAAGATKTCVCVCVPAYKADPDNCRYLFPPAP